MGCACASDGMRVCRLRTAGVRVAVRLCMCWRGGAGVRAFGVGAGQCWFAGGWAYESAGVRA
eukprot:1507512-Pyramimonas_sp.AAC.1